MSDYPFSESEYVESGHEWKPLSGTHAFLRCIAVAMLRNICESPIELLLGVEILIKAPLELSVAPQFKWQRWRMDFAITRHGNPVAFVECDGAAFHSTPEQIANDRAKDAAAEAAGIRMFRFTGGEIYRQAETCAATVFEALAA